MELKDKTIVFIDLDGTLIETASGDTFPRSILDIKVKIAVVEGLKKMFELKARSFYVFIVTNQLGISKGFLTEYDFKTKLNFIKAGLSSYLYDNRLCINMEGYHNMVINARYALDYSECRKPNTGMLSNLLDTYKLDYDKSKMIMIGDASGKEGQFSDSDKKCAENFGIDYLDVEDFVKLINEKYTK